MTSKPPYPITSSIPLPADYTGRGGRALSPIRLSLRLLEPGESFEVEKENIEKLRQAVVNETHASGKRFCIRDQRVWRVS